MKTTTRNPAHEAIAIWKQADAAHQAATRAWNETYSSAEKGRSVGGGLLSTIRLAVVGAEIAKLETEDALRLATVAASVALDASERADGDELAISVDPRALLADLGADLADEDRLRAELTKVEQRRAARLAATREALATLTSRRTTAGLPPPMNLPPFKSRQPNEVLEALDRLVTEDPKPSKSNEDRLRRLRNEEREIRADLERQHREREAQSAREAEYDREQAARHKREQERQRAEHEALVAKHAAERQKEEDLAAAHRAREAGASS